MSRLRFSVRDLPWLTLVVLVILAVSVRVNGEDKGKTPERKSSRSRPSEWSITIDFAGGAPGERLNRFTYEMLLSSDGRAKVENLREGGKKRVVLFEGSLGKDERETAYDAVITAIKGFDVTKGDSRGGDGWDVSVTLTTLKYSAVQRAIEIRLEDINSLRDAGPELASVFEMVNRHLSPANKIGLDRH